MGIEGLWILLIQSSPGWGTIIFRDFFLNSVSEALCLTKLGNLNSAKVLRKKDYFNFKKQRLIFFK